MSLKIKNIKTLTEEIMKKAANAEEEYKELLNHRNNLLHQRNNLASQVKMYQDTELKHFKNINVSLESIKEALLYLGNYIETE